MASPPITYQPSALIVNTASDVEPALLGCFAKLGNTVVLISASHVLFAKNDMAVSSGEGIYAGSYSSCCGGGPKIATTIKTWREGFRPLSGMTDTYDTDCAAAILEKGISYSNEIPQIGMIKGVAPEPPADWIMEDLTQVPDPQKMLRMYSPTHGGLRYGTLYYKGPNFPPPTSLCPGPFSASDDAEHSMMKTGNQLMVVPRLLPKAGESRKEYLLRYKAFVTSGQKITFGEPGDSGGIIVDNANPAEPKVIGLMSRAFSADALASDYTAQGSPPPLALQCATGIGIVTPIANVLKQLNVTIDPDMKGTMPASGRPAYVVSRILDRADIDDIQGALARLKQRLMQTRHGALVAEKLDAHQDEARRLVNLARQVSATWHRNRGPAFVQHMIKNLRNPAHRVPLMIDGVTLEELLTRMHAIFMRHGSDALKRDLARYGDFAIRALSGTTNLHDLVDALKPQGLEPE